MNSTRDAEDANPGDGVCATVADPTECTLRAAVQETNALATADRIDLPGGTYLITLGDGDDDAEEGDFDIDDTLTIVGAGELLTIVDGNDQDRVFDVQEGESLTMSNLTIQNGDNNGQGGGIRNEGALVLSNVTLRDNEGKDGGAIAVAKNGATATLTNVTLEDNLAEDGGGLFLKDNSTATITDSLFINNDVSKDGGGVHLDKGSVTIRRSLFTENSSKKGGGVHVKGNANVDIENSTISANTATNEGGGIHKDGNGNLDLVNVTIFENGAKKGGGVRRKKGGITVLNTIIANSTQDDDCEGAITSLGNNLDSDDSCGFNQVGDIPNTDPLLQALANNGGSTQTHALSVGSPAIDTGTNSGCPSTDQRGRPRPVDGDANGSPICDIGAYEAASFLMPIYSLSKSVSVLSDPESAVNPKAIPGAVVLYTIGLDNAGPGAADNNTLIISEALPPETALVVADFDGSTPGPVFFDQGSPPSGLSYTFGGLSDLTDDVEFSNNAGADYDYVPVPSLVDGTDSNVTHFRIRPGGTASNTGSSPVAEFRFKVVLR